MFNTNTFYGTDGVLTLSDPDGITPEVFLSRLREAISVESTHRRPDHQ